MQRLAAESTLKVTPVGALAAILTDVMMARYEDGMDDKMKSTGARHLKWRIFRLLVALFIAIFLSVITRDTGRIRSWCTLPL